MNLLTNAFSGLGAVLLPVAMGLLLEELMFGGLVRLLLAPWPVSRKQRVAGKRHGAAGRKPGEHNHAHGGEK